MHPRISILSFILLWQILVLGSPSAAHTVSNHQVTGWDSRDRAVDYSFISSQWPSENHKNRIRTAAATWNAVGAEMTFRGVGEYPYFDGSNCAGRGFQQNGMHWIRIDGAGFAGADRWATTITCPYPSGTPGGLGGWLHDVQIAFDKDQPNWYTGDGHINVLPLRADLWGTAVHEFGHFIGHGYPATFIHFDQRADGQPGAAGEGEICPYPPTAGSVPAMDPNEDTMCTQAALNDEYPRSLSTHDKHVFIQFYAQN